MVEGVKIQQVFEQAMKAAEAAEKSEPQVQQPVEEDLARLDQALGNEGVRTNEISVNPSEEKAVAAQDGPKSAGDRILESFDRLRAAHGERMESVKESVAAIAESDSVSPMDLFRIQTQFMEASLQIETTTKVVDKADQDVSTLLRSQS